MDLNLSDSDPNNESAFECYDTRLDQNICLQIMMIKCLTLLKMKPDCFDISNMCLCLNFYFLLKEIGPPNPILLRKGPSYLRIPPP